MFVVGVFVLVAVHGVAFGDVLEKTANRGCEAVTYFSLFRTTDLLLLQGGFCVEVDDLGCGRFQLLMGLPRSGIVCE